MRDKRPSTTGQRHTLPFEKLSPDSFEELCLWLLRREGYDAVRHIGAAGQDGGVDLVADRGGERVAVQCKRESRFGPKKTEAAVTGLLAEPLDPPATRLLLMVSSKVSHRAETAARNAAGGLPVEIWAVTELNERTSRHDDILDQFFWSGAREPKAVEAAGRGIGVDGDIEGSILTTGNGSPAVGGDIVIAARDVARAQRDVNITNIHPPVSASARVPLTAPAPPQHFTGRAKILDRLTSLLLSGESVGLTALQGMGGIGKTAVARKLAERLRTEHSATFPGGVLWSELGPDPNILTVLDGWARAARPDSDFSSNTDPKSRALAVRQLLATQGRFCAILDDVWETEPARLLFDALPPDCPRLITTRLGDLSRSLQCRPHRLDRLSKQEALDLITKHLGDVEDFEDAARQVVEQTEALPLAIEIAMGLIDEPCDLGELADDLARKPRLEVLTRGKVREDSIEICFSLSYERLDAADQRRFRALGAFAGAPFDRAAVAAVWGEDEIDSNRLRFFDRRNLLQSARSTRVFRFHGLLKDYARMLLELHGETREVRDRHAEHYGHLAASAPWQTTEAAYEQLRHGWNHVAGDPKRSAAYALSCVDFQRIRGHWQDREHWLSLALAHNTRGYLTIRARLLLELGTVYSDLGRKDQAFQRYEEALDVQREAGDRRGAGATLSNIALMYSHLGRKDQALQRYKEALDLQREVGNREGEGTTLNNIAAVYYSLNRKHEALRLYEEALAVNREASNQQSEGVTLNNIALVYSDLGHKDDALRRFKEALRILREAGARQYEGTTIHNIALVYSDLGRKNEALRRYQEALEVRLQTGDSWGEPATRFNIGSALRSLGRLREAVQALEACVALEEALGHPDLDSDRAFLEQVRKELAESEGS